MRRIDRRSVVAGGGAILLLSVSRVQATTDDMRAAMREAFGDATIREGKVQLDIPALVENGNSVPLAITVESPMTEVDHVKAIHVFAPENPLPEVSRFVLSPRNGMAHVKTTIRLATSQDLYVIAQMSDGSLWRASAEIEVTTAACFDPT